MSLSDQPHKTFEKPNGFSPSQHLPGLDRIRLLSESARGTKADMPSEFGEFHFLVSDQNPNNEKDELRREHAKEIDAAIKQLDSENFSEREAGTATLKSLGREPLDALKAAYPKMTAEQRARTDGVIRFLNSHPQLCKQLSSQRDRAEAASELARGQLASLPALQNALANPAISKEEQAVLREVGATIYGQLGLKASSDLREGTLTRDGQVRLSVEVGGFGNLDRITLYDETKGKELELCRKSDGTYTANGSDHIGREKITDIRLENLRSSIDIYLIGESGGPLVEYGIGKPKKD